MRRGVRAARAGGRGGAAGLPGALHGRCASRSSWDLVGDALAVAFGFDARAGAGRSHGRRGGARRGDAAVEWSSRACSLAAAARSCGARWLAVGALVLVARRSRVGGRRLQPGDRPRGWPSSRPTPAIRELQRAAPGALRHASGTSPRTRSRWTTRSPRRAATTCRSRSASTGCGAPSSRPSSRRRSARCPRSSRSCCPRSTPERLRCLSLPRRQPRAPAADATRRCACRGCGWSIAGPDARSTPTTPRCRGRSSWAASGGRVGTTRYAEITARGFDAAPRGDRRGRHAERARPGSPAPARILAHRERPPASSRCAPTGPGMLVVSDAWAPGWHGEGRRSELKVERVDYLFRGVRVPAGRHIVEFTYRPLSWRIGWIVSLLAFVGAGRRVCASAQVKRARRRELDGVRAIAALLRARLPRRRLLGARLGRGRRDPAVGRAGWTSAWRSSSCSRASCSTGPFLRAAGCGSGAYACAARPADRARLLGGADGRGDRAAAARACSRPERPDASTASRRSTADADGGQGLGQAWTLCVEVLFYAFLPLWALLHRPPSRRAVAAGGAVRARASPTRWSCSAGRADARRAARAAR